uniref:Transient receptor potential cation channel subfamily V member 2 n=1 Tax=Macaca nemestrina TaxID=9545 RepID=A0A2K6BDR5_MACNE
MTVPPSSPVFRLETLDGGQEDGAEVDEVKPALGSGLTPMESPFQGEDRKFAPQIKVNLKYGKGTGASQPDPNRFDRDRLFNAVSRGVPEDLAGLPEYLCKTSKYLTDSEYTEGSTGKTCLMKAVLNLKDGVNACILPLLQIDRDSGNPQPLVNAQCTDDYYRGHSALHIAIEKRSLQCVKLLVENGANVHAQACGRFFQKGQGTCFYFGELPLSLAACTKQWDVVSYLLENPHQPASLQATDSQGNTVLHALVMISDNSAENIALVTSMYDGLLQAGARLCPTVQLEDIRNRQDLTPLKLAAKEGKIEIFRHILQREFSGLSHLSRKFTEWCYGPVRVSLYDLASVDSCEENSVLEIIAFHCKSPHRHRMVVLEPLNKLLQAKWDLLIPRFFLNFLCNLIYMFIFTAVAYHQPALKKQAAPHPKAEVGNSMLLAGHIFVLLAGIYLLVGQLWYFWRRHLFIWMSFIDSYFEILFLFQSLLTVLSQVLCFLAIEWYLPLLVSALVLGWLNLLYYTRGFQHTGIYSVMIQKRHPADLLRSLLIYLLSFGSLEAWGPEAPTGPQCTSRAARGQEMRATGSVRGYPKPLGALQFTPHASASRKRTSVHGALLLRPTSAHTSCSISVLEMENGYWWCRKKQQRAGVMLTVGTKPDGSADERWCFRVEEVNWASWEQTLPTLCEDPSGAGVPRTLKNPVLASPPKDEDGASEEDHVPLQPLQSN